MKDLKKELWELIDSNTNNISSVIGWGSMDSLIEEIINTKKEFTLCDCCKEEAVVSLCDKHYDAEVERIESGR